MSLNSIKFLKELEIINEGVKFFVGEKYYMATGDLSNEETNDLELVSYNKKPSRAALTAKPGDVIFARMKGTNKVLLITEKESDYIFSTGFVVLRSSENVNKSYLTHYLKSSLFQVEKDKLCTGATQKSINNQNIEKLKFPLPQLGTQNSISEILDTVNELRHKDQELLKKYNDLAQSIFIDMFNENKTVVKLNSISTKITDGVHAKPNYQESGVPFLSVKNVTNKFLDFKNTKFISQKDHELYIKRCKPEFEDILYTKVGATYGRSALIDSHVEFSIYVSVALIKPDKSKVYPKYLNFVLNSVFVKKQADRRVKGAGVPDLHLIEIKDFDIPLPSYEEQLEFSNIIEILNANMNFTKEQIYQSDNLFNSLIKKAFNGELVI